MTNENTDTDRPVRDHVYAERQANRAAEAAKDAATAIAEGRADEDALKLLYEAEARINRAKQYLGIAAGQPVDGAR